MVVEMNRISTHKKSTQGIQMSTNSGYARKLIEGAGMYTFVYGKGSKRKSETRHMTESQAKQHKSYLESLS